MLSRLIEFSVRRPGVILVGALLVVLAGLWSLRQLPLDAFPDTTPVQVQINTVAPALAPLEIEQQITLPVEQAIGGTAGPGRGPLDLALRPLAGHRHLRRRRRHLPRPAAGQGAAGDGRASRKASTGRSSGRWPPAWARSITTLVTGRRLTTLTELRTIHDWVVKPRAPLRARRGRGQHLGRPRAAVPGRSSIRSGWASYGLTLADVTARSKNNNLNVGGGNLPRGGEARLVQGIGLVTGSDQIGDVVLTSNDGVPVRVRDVAEVASATRSAAAPSPPTARARPSSAWASCSWARTAAR